MRIYRFWTAEEKDYLCRHYPGKGSAAVAKALCRTADAVSQKAIRMGVRLSDEYNKEVRRASHAKMGATRRKIFRMEHFRIRSGMPQQTRILFNEYPKRVRSYVYGAISRRHYFHCEGDPFDVLYYDEETLRTPNEALMAARYGVKFVPFTTT